MIKLYVERFMANKSQLENVLKQKHVDSYKELVTEVVKLITSGEYDDLDPERIHEIDDGDYQGTLLFLIAEKGYQPSKYWAVKVGYGSCSGCDTLQSISGYSSDAPTQEQVDEYMMLALHIVQGLKEI